MSRKRGTYHYVDFGTKSGGFFRSLYVIYAKFGTKSGKAGRRARDQSIHAGRSANQSRFCDFSSFSLRPSSAAKRISVTS